MAKGVIYVLTSNISGLIKIGKAGTDNYAERMRNLQKNGYSNVTGLKPFFAIEVEDYDDKEKLLHRIFSYAQTGDSEFFSIDEELVQQLLLSFDGRVVYPEQINKEEEFDAVTKAQQQSALFSFYKKGITKGDVITFRADPSETAVVTGERDVEYDGQTYKLSRLTRRIYDEKGQGNKSGAYQGAEHWAFGGMKLKKLPDTETR